MPKTRPYKPTKITRKSLKKYNRNYWRKFRSGKPGAKRHGGGRK